MTTLRKIRLGIASALAIVLLVFTLQNTQVVEVRLLFWKVEMSRALMLFGVLVIGMVIGWVGRAPTRTR